VHSVPRWSHLHGVEKQGRREAFIQWWSKFPGCPNSIPTMQFLCINSFTSLPLMQASSARIRCWLQLARRQRLTSRCQFQNLRDWPRADCNAHFAICWIIKATDWVNSTLFWSTTKRFEFDHRSGLKVYRRRRNYIIPATSGWLDGHYLCQGTKGNTTDKQKSQASVPSK